MIINPYSQLRICNKEMIILRYWLKDLNIVKGKVLNGLHFTPDGLESISQILSSSYFLEKFCTKCDSRFLYQKTHYYQHTSSIYYFPTWSDWFSTSEANTWNTRLNYFIILAIFFSFFIRTNKIPPRFGVSPIWAALCSWFCSFFLAILSLGWSYKI